MRSTLLSLATVTVALAMSTCPALSENAYYTFDTQTISDSSGHAHNGSVYGHVSFPVGVPPAHGYALETYGHDSGANLPASASSGLTQVSVSLWFYAAEKRQPDGNIYNALVYRANQKGNAGELNYSDRTFALFWLTGGGLQFDYTAAGATSQTVCFDGSPPSGTLVKETWYQVAFTIDAPGNSAKLYVNGTLVATCQVPAPSLHTGNYKISLGRPLNKQTYITGGFRGQLDNVHFYDRILTPSEIRTLYKDQD